MSLMTFDKRRGSMVTSKQVMILKALLKRNPDGTTLDVYQLIDRVAPGTTRGSMISSLRHLASHGFVAEGPMMERRSRVMRTYVITDTGIELIRPNSLKIAP